VKLKNESYLFATKSNLSRVYAYVVCILVFGFCKKNNFKLDFFLYSNLKNNNGHWGLSTTYILLIVLQPLEWNKNLKDIQDKWNTNQKNPYEFQKTN
jgi:hypothetical protein